MLVVKISEDAGIDGAIFLLGRLEGCVATVKIKGETAPIVCRMGLADDDGVSLLPVPEVEGSIESARLVAVEDVVEVEYA